MERPMAAYGPSPLLLQEIQVEQCQGLFELDLKSNTVSADTFDLSTKSSSTCLTLTMPSVSSTVQVAHNCALQQRLQWLSFKYWGQAGAPMRTLVAPSTRSTAGGQTSVSGSVRGAT